ncbi:MAG: glycosyltransferase family 2 protein [Alistipes putredinis]|uniref:glycosyltransferase family 2 protein n=1 Tax=Alistipes putredinis TaxID=28117 RepID=UPI0039A3E04F
MKTGEAKSIPYPLPKTTVTGHFLFCTPRLRYKDRESRFEPDAQRSNAKTVYLDARRGSRYRRSTPCRPSPTTPAQKSPKLKTFRNPIGKNHKFKINDLHKQYFSSNRYLCKRIKYIIYFSHAHRFGHCSQLLSCSLSRQRIESILQQTFQDFELILLDDCSTDGSREILERYRNHPKVSGIFYNERNSGSPFKQWKKGLSKATGDYVWIAESDDFSSPCFLERCVRILDTRPDCSIVFTS